MFGLSLIQQLQTDI